MLLSAARAPRRTPGDTYLRRPVVEIAVEFRTAPRQLISRWLIIFWDLRPSHVTRLDLSAAFFFLFFGKLIISVLWVCATGVFFSPVYYKNQS